MTLTRNDFNNIAQARLLLSEGGLLEGISPRPRRRRARSGILRASLPHLFRAVRLSLLAEILLRQGRASEAVELAREALALDRTTACVFALRQEAISVLLAEALHASGDIDAARAAIRESRNVLLAGSAKIADSVRGRACLADGRRCNLVRAPGELRIGITQGGYWGATAGPGAPRRGQRQRSARPARLR